MATSDAGKLTKLEPHNSEEADPSDDCWRGSIPSPDRTIKLKDGSGDSKEHVITDANKFPNLEADNSEESDPSDDCWLGFAPSPDRKIKVEDGCSYDLIEGYEPRSRRVASLECYLEDPAFKRIKKNQGMEDVVTDHVLPFLPAKTLSRFRAVSKEWDQLITSPFFMHKQTNSFWEISGLFCQLPGDMPFFVSLNQYAYGVPSPSLGFLPEPVSIRTSCNGLLCCQSCNGENTYYICNPANQEFRALPKSSFYHGTEPALALSFEPSVLNFAEHYELICAFSLADHPVTCFEIFSSRSCSWRLADTQCCELDALKLNGDGLFLKGVAFWETFAGAILAFDLKEEQYGILSLPLNHGPHGVLTEMKGELCYILPRQEDNKYFLDIYGDMELNLKRSVSLDHELFENFRVELRALACVNNNVVIIDVAKRLVAYNVKSRKGEMLRTRTDIGDGYLRYLPYVNSLVQVCRPSDWSSQFSVDSPTAAA